MKTRRVLALVASAFCFTGPARADWWQDLKDLHAYKYERAKDAFYNGRNDWYASGYTWHAPWAYSHERRHHELNNAAWGGGFGRSVVDDNGNTHSLYALAMQDSHFKPQYGAGYLWMTYWPLADRLQGGLGYTVFLVSRSDMWHRFPIPGIVPAASLRWREAELIGTFVPGLNNGGGNVGSVVMRFSF
jgi:lipid IVA palmitoyltransferase